MHEWAERGLAAHWAYKAQEGIDPTEVGASQSLMEDLRDILDNAETSEEVVEHTKLDLFQDQVFCFSPKGDLIRLPKGPTRSILPMRFIVLLVIAASVQKLTIAFGTCARRCAMAIKSRF